jgi:aerobic C4-dicarboxylate transport protein
MATASAVRKKPFYANLWVQVLIAIAAAIVLGYVNPARAIAMKPLGDGFIRLITMLISLIIFCTVVSGIASMQDLKKVGRVGGKALLYFEVVSTLALLVGMVVGNVVHPCSGFNVNPANLDSKSVVDFAGQATKRKASPNSCCTSFQTQSLMPLPKATSCK